MEILQAIVLGIVQGLTEFLPVSSSGHLVIVRDVLRWPDTGLLFDAILHFGTLIAIVVYFRKEIAELFKALGRIVKTGKLYDDEYKKMLVHLVIATLPIVVVGLLVVDVLEEFTRGLTFTGSMLIVTSAILFGTLALKKQDGKVEDMKNKSALWIGVAQCLALLPGISRSGSTIAAGMATGLKREEAARFSFLMGAIGIFAANVLLVFDAVKEEAVIDLLPFTLGFLASLIVSYLAIHYFLAFLRKYKLTVFAIYALALGAFAILFDVFYL